MYYARVAKSDRHYEEEEGRGKKEGEELVETRRASGRFGRGQQEKGMADSREFGAFRLLLGAIRAQFHAPGSAGPNANGIPVGTFLSAAWTDDDRGQVDHS